MRRATDAIAAAAEALFPPNDRGAPDWLSADMVRRTRRWLSELPPESRRLVTLLFVATELAAPLLMPALGRFSRTSPRRRLRAMQRWCDSRFAPLRFFGTALESTMKMMYLSHPDSMRYVGVYKTTAHPDDPLQVEVRPDALSARTPAGSP
ncbi:MAG: hypothetical protein H6744_01320 [Deltaproteobacteria bacterium]|nr:hypothetical protein [Deltaproteobacteria bacterium]